MILQVDKEGSTGSTGRGEMIDRFLLKADAD